MALLEAHGLTVQFGTEAQPFTAVDDIDLSLEQGEIVGCVGESGSGKSVMALAVMGLIEFRAECAPGASASPAATCWRCPIARGER